MPTKPRNGARRPAATRQDASSASSVKRGVGSAEASCEAPGGPGEAVHADRRARRGSSTARLISAKARADRAALRREQFEAEEKALAPMVETLDRLEAAARERGDELSLARHRQVAILFEQLSEAAKPKPQVSADDRELLVEAVAKLGVDAATEALKRARAAAKRQRA